MIFSLFRLVLKESGGSGGLLSKVRSLIGRNKNKTSEEAVTVESVKAKSE